MGATMAAEACASGQSRAIGACRRSTPADCTSRPQTLIRKLAYRVRLYQFRAAVEGMILAPFPHRFARNDRRKCERWRRDCITCACTVRSATRRQKRRPNAHRPRCLHPGAARRDQETDHRATATEPLQRSSMSFNRMGQTPLLAQTLKCYEKPDDGHLVTLEGRFAEDGCSAKCLIVLWYRLPGSNGGPPDPQSGALTN